MRAVVLTALLTLATPALAQSIPFPGPGTPAGAASYAGPVDVLASPVECWSVQACSAAIAAGGTTTSLKSVKRSSDGHTCDVLLATNGAWGNTTNCSTGGENGTAIATWCNATTCQPLTVTGQVNGRDASVGAYGATLGFSPNKIDCSGTAVAYDTHFNGTPNFSVPQPATVSFVAKRTSATTSYNTVGSFDSVASQAGFSNSSGKLLLYAGTVVDVTTVDAEGSQFAVQAMFDGSSSRVYENGHDNTGLNPGTGSSTSAPIAICGTSGSNLLKGDWFETLIYQGSAADHTNYPASSMNSNQRTRFGF